MKVLMMVLMIGFSTCLFSNDDFPCEKAWVIKSATSNFTKGAVMIGDSITCGLDRHIINGKYVINAGVNGNTAKDILNRIETVTESKAEKAFIMVGVNDLLKGHSLVDVYSSYTLITKELTKANILVYIQSTIHAGSEFTLLNRKINTLNNKLKKLATDSNMVYIDLNKNLSPQGFLNDKYTTDSIHLNAIGYSKWELAIQSYF